MVDQRLTLVGMNLIDHFGEDYAMRTDVDHVDDLAVKGNGRIYSAWCAGCQGGPAVVVEAILHPNRSDSGDNLGNGRLNGRQPIHGTNARSDERRGVNELGRAVKSRWQPQRAKKKEEK